MQKNKVHKMETGKFSLRKIIDNNLFFLKLIHKASPWFLSSSVVITAVEACVEFVSDTFMLRFALNGINVGRPFRTIAAVMLIWMAVRIAVAGVVSHYRQRLYPVRLTDVKQKLHTMVFQKAAEVELECYENPKYYDTFVKAMGECSGRAEEVSNALLNVLRQGISFLANFALIIFIDPVLLLFAFIPLLVIPLQSRANRLGYQKEMEMREEKRRKDYSRRTFYLSEYAKEMRLFNMPELMLKRFQESGGRIIDIIKKYGLSLAALNYLTMECTEMLAALSVTIYAVWRTLGAGTMGCGDCIVVVNSIDVIAHTFTDSAGMLLKFQENAFYIENLRTFLDYEPTVKGGVSELPSGGDIVLENVSFRYDGAAEDSLKQLNMRFGEKEKVAVVGHNGAGKTTLVKLLLRLYDAQGTITYGNTDIRKFPLGKYRDIFSVVMQDFHIFALSVADNVMLRRCRPGEEERVREALKQSGLLEKVRTFPEEIHTFLTREFDEKGMQLSGGEQQKLAISHVYSGQNRFVILDEPSSALDPIAEYEMYESMMKACENCGMIFISHRLSSAVMADRIYMMDGGMVIEEGTHAGLMDQNGKYAEMFRKQAQNYAEVAE